jgi:UDP-N-acetylglucosamine acyltransferase
VILANNVQVGGHVTIGDWVTLGGSAGVHQFCHVGDHSMVGASRPYTQDILPYSLVAGYPVKCYGVNIVGLRRRGFSSHTINTLKTLFRFLMSKKMTAEQIQRKIDDEVEKIPEVLKVLEFIEKSERGVIR